MNESWHTWRQVLAASIVLFCLAAASPSPAHAQQPHDLPIGVIERAFSEGHAELLMSCAAERIEMAVLGAGMLYSRGQAVYVMQKFFRQHPPRDFNVREVSHAGGNWFATGIYWANGESAPHRVYLRFQNAAEEWILIEVRIGGGGP